MNENELIKFYINNGKSKTAEMLRERKYIDFLNYMTSPECNCTQWAKNIAKELKEML